MAHHIKPKSVSSYLSGICNQLEPFFPDVRSHRRHWLVTKTLIGCRKMLPSTTTRKRPISRTELTNVAQQYATSTSLDNTLFLAILLTRFHGLLRLGELTWPDNSNHRDYRKVVMRNTVRIHPKSFEFTLPGHKADRLFEGSRVLIQSTELGDDTLRPFTRFLAMRDRLFPLRPELWLTESGFIPTRTWFLRRFHRHCWNYYQLLRLCHDYVITVLSPTFLSYLSHLFAYELPRSNGIYLCITAFFASVLSTCQHLSVPTPLFPHKQISLLLDHCNCI